MYASFLIVLKVGCQIMTFMHIKLYVKLIHDIFVNCQILNEQSVHQIIIISWHMAFFLNQHYFIAYGSKTENMAAEL